LLIGFAIGKFASSAAVATDDGTSGADGRIESIGESDTGADAGADDSGTDATADDGIGTTDGATADFVEFDVPQPATNSAVTATPTAMRTLGRIPHAVRAHAVRARAVRAVAVALIVAFTVDDGDGGRDSTQ
jgi:hypothetical protein